GDTWDLASSVGATATMVAAARAAATRSSQPVITDEYAEPLVRAVGLDVFPKLASGELDSDDLEKGVGFPRIVDTFAARARFYDDYFAAAGKAGVRQVVIMASGLDARSYRLAWPAGTTVYEIDQPEVIAFKTATLTGLGAEPTADRRTVAIDLRQDWPTALREAGFDPDRPTAWIAEGLLGYLPPDAQDRLLDNITALSAAGSRFATESIAGRDDLDEEAIKERMKAVSARWREHGFDLDMTELIYFGDRNEAAEYLKSHSWEIIGRTNRELFADYGLEPLETDQPFGDVVYVSGILK